VRLFVFPGTPGTTTLILTVNPDAGRSSPTTFRPDALYEFVVASDGGTREDIAFRVAFTEPDDAGTQQIPDADLGGTRVAVWARVNLVGHAPQLQVSRIGQAMLRPLFFSPADTESETLNTGAPGTDTDAHGKRVHGIASAAARLAGLPDPDAHAEHVQAAFLPDVVTYQPGQPASFQPGGGNGRALDDDAFDIAVAVLAGSALGSASVPRPPTALFPYLSAPQPGDLPALADVFGLREHRPQ
jgi:Domain of unknown function (DUF4331)